MLKRTNTENMFIDRGTTEMTGEHVHRVLNAGRWCYRYNRDYVKQTIKSKKGVKGAGTRSTETGSMTIVGEPLDASYSVFNVFTICCVWAIR